MHVFLNMDTEERVIARENNFEIVVDNQKLLTRKIGGNINDCYS